MKRFGVQLAASGIVVLLGALGVAQAQRDSRKTESTQWEAPASAGLNAPPRPIGDAQPNSGQALTNDAGTVSETDGPATMSMGSFGFPTSMSAVQTVGHEETVAAPGTETTDDSASNSPATLGLPSWSLPESSSPPTAADSASAPPTQFGQAAAASLAMPGFDQLPPADDPAETAVPSPPSIVSPSAVSPSVASPSSVTTDDKPNYGAMPTIDFGGAPATNSLSASTDSPTNALRSVERGVEPSESANLAPTPSPSDLGTPVAFGPADLQPVDAAVPATTAMASQYQPRDQPDARIASLPTAGLRNLASSAPVLDEAVLAEPGDRRLEGMQSPSVVIHKRAPGEVKVGKPATFTIQVQNTGGVEALDVQVHDRIPAGMRLVDATPSPDIQGDILQWQLGALEPGGERSITLQLIPEQEGELGSVARVTFEAAASVRTISTRPELKITQRAPERVLIGQQLEIELEVSNPGTGSATGVILQEDVPEGLEHPKGRQLDNVIGTLAPGEVRRQVLRLRAVSAGQVQNLIRLTGDDGLIAENAVQVEVIAPQLAIELDGPSRRFLERQAVFNVNLANIGTADATNVEVVAYLDRGFSFIGTEYQGQYDPQRHAVYWSLAELPADGKGSVPLRLLPIEQGERAIRLEAKGDLNLIAQHQKTVSVDTLAELTFSITDDADPIEVGSDVTYEIRINNRGSRDDADVKMQMQLPAGLELVSSEAEASTDGRGLIAFAPTSTLAAGGEIVHRIRVRGVTPGTHVVKAIVNSVQATVPVTKEESTMVYADQ